MVYPLQCSHMIKSNCGRVGNNKNNHIALLSRAHLSSVASTDLLYIIGLSYFFQNVEQLELPTQENAFSTILENVAIAHTFQYNTKNEALHCAKTEKYALRGDASGQVVTKL